MARCKNCKNLDHILNSGVSVGRWCVEKSDSPDIERERICDKFVPMSQGDKIRSMTDEELSRFLNSNCPSCTEFCDEFEGGCMFECRYNRGDDIILKWLKSEVGCE